ncbi:uncharacterized protein LOC121786314 [Salvia splendens]|uniref:uncharacterized protein LOC121786314 n=1 Tax=Salvia splendens TaxID=180675 RepID=UPI001C25BBFC|nr:uncharacterized protein LOC121786314 [Salvia splendens]
MTSLAITSFKSTISLHAIGKQVESVRQKGRSEFALLIVSDEDRYGKPEVRPPRLKDVVGFVDVSTELIQCGSASTLPVACYSQEPHAVGVTCLPSGCWRISRRLS